MSEIIVQVDNLSKSFGCLEVIRDVSFTVGRGEVLGIIGPSGSGKSTMLRCITQLETVSGGSISICGKQMVKDGTYTDKKSLHQIGLQVGLVFQNFNLFPHFSVLRNITEAQIHVLGRSKIQAQERARELLFKMGLSEKENAYPCELSGGQQQRVSIARALALDPQVLFFDEPTSALDPEMVGEVLDLMKSLAKEGMTMIIVTHEMGFAREVANKVLFIDDGQILVNTSPEEFFGNPTNPRLKDFLSKVL